MVRSIQIFHNMSVRRNAKPRPGDLCLTISPCSAFMEILSFDQLQQGSLVALPCKSLLRWSRPVSTLVSLAGEFRITLQLSQETNLRDSIALRIP